MKDQEFSASKIWDFRDSWKEGFANICEIEDQWVQGARSLQWNISPAIGLKSDDRQSIAIFPSYEIRTLIEDTFK